MRKDPYYGLGGWLILVGIGVVTSPFRLIFSVVPIYFGLFSEGAWDNLINPNSIQYIPYFHTLVVLEIIYNILMILASFYLIYLFFAKHPWFPKLYIYILVVSFIVIVLDSYAASLIIADTEVFDEDTVTELIRVGLASIIWIPYMLVSRRVEVTFTDEDTDVLKKIDESFKSDEELNSQSNE